MPEPRDVLQVIDSVEYMARHNPVLAARASRRGLNWIQFRDAYYLWLEGKTTALMTEPQPTFNRRRARAKGKAQRRARKANR